MHGFISMMEPHGKKNGDNIDGEASGDRPSLSMSFSPGGSVVAVGTEL